MRNIVNSFSLTHVVPRNTHFSPSGAGSLIDLAFNSCQSSLCSCSTIPPLGTSDPGWSRTAMDCPLPDSTCWDILGHPRPEGVLEPQVKDALGYPRTSQDVPDLEAVLGPRVPDQEVVLSPRCKMSWDIRGHPGMSQTWRQC